MDYEKQLIWIVPSEMTSDSDVTFFPFKLGDRDHRTRCHEFCENNKLLNYPEGGSHNDWGKYLTEHNFSVFFNSGVTVDGLYYGTLYLPVQLSENQIDFFNKRRQLFEEKYNPDIFGIQILPDHQLEYTNNGFRNLKIEAIINNIKYSNNFELLYIELENQRKNLEHKKL